MTIQVTSGKPSRHEQIERLLGLLRQREDSALRLRLLVQIYNPDERSYDALRDAFWGMKIPLESASVEGTEALVGALGTFMIAVAAWGPKAVESGLRRGLPELPDSKQGPQLDYDTDDSEQG